MCIRDRDTYVPQTTLQLSLYERNKDGRLQAVDTLDFDTPVNRVTNFSFCSPINLKFFHNLLYMIFRYRGTLILL